MKSKKSTVSNSILNFLAEVAELVPAPFETPYNYIRRTSGIKRDEYARTLRRMKKRGLVQVVKRDKQKFIALTKKGELRELFNQIRLAKLPPEWDKKWRMLIFDIPEQSRSFRDKLRSLLKLNNFAQLQQSVFISPYPLNRGAIKYLEVTGLRKFIRVMRVDEMDNENELLLRFKIKRPLSDGR